MEDSKPVSRRRHAAELKKQVLAACAEPGASVAQVALTPGLNASLVHKSPDIEDPRAERPVVAELSRGSAAVAVLHCHE